MNPTKNAIVTDTASQTHTPADALDHLLDVTRKLAGPFELMDMLEEVLEAGKAALNVDKVHVWLHDPDTLELVLRMPADAERVRLPVDRGILGECARTREIINVPDCYADPRFSRTFDDRTGYKSDNMLVLPLIGHDETLVGVLQLLNDRDGVFDENDQRIGAYMAAQCAVALQRVQMSDALVASARLKEDVSVAREVQMSTLPSQMPKVEGYDLFGTFLPADETGGDTFDIVTLDDDRLFVLMGDATGHGIGPALPATQMQAMFRLALRLGTDLDSAFTHVNNQLTEDLTDDRFVTAFVGLLDPSDHNMYFHSGGQGPILHFRAATKSWDRHKPTSFPLGIMELEAAKRGKSLGLAPGDILVLLSDGVYEYENRSGELFGDERVQELFSEHRDLPTVELGRRLLEEVYSFGGSSVQRDDITVVLVKRVEG